MKKKGTFMKNFPLITIILLTLLTCGLFAADFYLFTVSVTVMPDIPCKADNALDVLYAQLS